MKNIKFNYFYELDGRVHFVKKHEVSIDEVEEFILYTDIFERKRNDDSFEAIGKLESGRYLKVIYRIHIKEKIKEYFIITAFDIYDQAEKNYINKKLKN